MAWQYLPVWYNVGSFVHEDEGMTKKKASSLPVSQEELTQVQHLLEQVHQIANILHSSVNENEANDALTDFNTMSEAAQMALLKALSKEQETDAADVLIAVNELSPIKNVRKEARRSLIRLEEIRVYPQWRPPDARTPFIQLDTTPKGLILDDVDLDEDQERTSTTKGRGGSEMRLTPRFSLDLDVTFEPEDVVYEFIEAWTDGEYGFAYELLSSDSELRERLSQEEWIERRRTWAEQAQPKELLIAFVREREEGKANLKLPTASVGYHTAKTREVEISWSLELKDTSAGETLKEMPLATAIYNETGRHWFWTSYTFVEEEDEWRIQSMTDQGANAQKLPVEELKSRIEKLDTELKEIVRKKKLDEIDFNQLEDIETFLEEPRWIANEVLHYDDTFIALQPEDQPFYELAAIHAMVVEDLERASVYMELQVERFPEQQAENLQKLGLTQLAMSERYYEDEMDEESERYRKLSISTLRNSLALEDTASTRIMLANLLFDDDNLNEAEDQLHQAGALPTEDDQMALIEFVLGDIAKEREQFDQALHHYQHAVEFDPTYAEAWLNLGRSQHTLGQISEAEVSIKRSIELDPNDYHAYSSLGRMYLESEQRSKAREILEQGLLVNQDSADLRVFLAIVLMAIGDHRRAEKLLDEAEEIDPDLEFIQTARQALKRSSSQKPDSRKKKRSGR
jgi:tetratricopeptide (TPR) repeat protein